MPPAPRTASALNEHPPPARARVPQAVLRFICQTAEALGAGPAPSRTFLSFYAVTVCELVAAAPRVSPRLGGPRGNPLQGRRGAALAHASSRAAPRCGLPPASSALTAPAAAMRPPPLRAQAWR
jgi:hypothetical protein